MLIQTPFIDIHKKNNAKLIDFGGFEMPVQYEGIKKEHTAVREAVGMFDVSHMGEIYVTGADALSFVQHITINDASKLFPGRAQYSAMCYPDGGIVDDLLVYMIAEDHYLLVVNASNKEKDFKWMLDNNKFNATVIDKSDDTCLLAIQGPKAIETLQKLTDTDLSAISFYHFEMGSFAGYDNVILSATGYTGESGFELYFDKNETDPETIWNSIMEAGEEFGIVPAGLGARDTLRLEMGFALYGNDITKDTHPLESRLGWITKFEKGDFIGKDSLAKIKEEGFSRRMVGFKMEADRKIPRKDYEICNADGQVIGIVTSGGMSVKLDIGIGMGFVEKEFAAEGTEVYIRIRKKDEKAIVTKPPFVKK